MKKNLIWIIVTMIALVSCGKENIEPTIDIAEPTVASIAFNLTANHPDATKATKGGWETGDAIFVFFNNVAAPKYLKMSYDGTAWSSAEMDGSTVTAGALDLKNGDTGTMRAVFLPFGSDATVSASGTDFVFNKTWYAYYLTATLDYTVADNAVSGAFNMTIPEGYVQFFIEDAAATDEAYTLGCDAVIPTGLASITSAGAVTETSDKTAADDMPGYAYSGGYLFSGKLGSWGYGSNYYFAKIKTADNSRADYFVTGKTLSSHSAVKLPANDDIYAVVAGTPNDGKWIPVGSGTFVGLYASDMTTSLGTWHTCNYNQSVPEAVGSTYTFADANALGATLPTKEQFELTNNSSDCYWISVHGQQGTVVKAARGFLFFPAHDGTNGGFWSSTIDSNDNNYAWSFYISGPVHTVGRTICYGSYPVRPVLITPSAVEFSVSSTSKVAIAPGNLQATYDASAQTWTWDFAAHQYDRIGNAPGNTTITTEVKESTEPYAKLSESGTVDLFDWSTTDTYYGISTSNDDTYTNATTAVFVDWGGLPIGSYSPGYWRTLSWDEWDYMLFSRNASTIGSTENARFLKVSSVVGMKGLIIFPDNFTWDENLMGEAPACNNSGSNGDGTFSAAQWAALEAAGAVILPSTGWRLTPTYVETADNAESYGVYWTSDVSRHPNLGPGFLYFKYGSRYGTVGREYRYSDKSGVSVRLVHDL